MHLSVLDQSTVVTGRAPDTSIRESLALAKHAEALGYHRYWVAEHHNSDSIAGSAPEILISAIAATTQRIRVGSAGVMLPHYSSLKVAEQFRVLEAIAPGRIDLGLGRAPGSDGLTAHALNPNAAVAADHFPAQIRDLLAWLAGERLVEKHPFRDIRAQPQGATVPEVWILGSSDYGAQVAAHFGLPYCFAHFITDGQGAAEAIELYRTTYRPSARHPEPYAAVCVWALAADTQDEAARLFSSRGLARLWRDRGVFAPLPSPEEAASFDYTDSDLARLERIRARAIHGTPDVVAARLRALSEALGVQEAAVLTTVHDPAARRRSYALLAAEFGLAAKDVALAAQ
ncbi:LLM class flavin-dependent oxidoreductase [Limobrevibacterium gyesilva]|uniref:Luciferase-like monooxygenase n=1 Tax=Limobrevibacterium gyesilva TaxID=2991712 RepID=A0AA42CJE5_9PROT|nr:LLM class flavin-dependent oxidoreductase [Limobrevibacterium gyesilva]MCW3476795.1 LLM class flavin-dependent oxidoreductase [Limobrevibacterium gyesilva]